MERLEKQLALVIELDKLKSILRRTRVKSAEGRLENSGEHSWHVALMAILMEEHANAPVDICRVMKMQGERENGAKQCPTHVGLGIPGIALRAKKRIRGLL